MKIRYYCFCAISSKNKIPLLISMLCYVTKLSQNPQIYFQLDFRCSNAFTLLDGLRYILYSANYFLFQEHHISGSYMSIYCPTQSTNAKF